MASLKIQDLFSVKGKHVLVTGGGRGIGFMIAQGFVENGATVYISSRKQAACDEAAARLTAIGPGRCISLKAVDLTGVEAAETVVQSLRQHTDRLHVLVNNSGISWGEPFEKFQEKGFDKVFAVNVRGLFFMTRAAMPLLEAAATSMDPARIINIGSVAGLMPQAFPTYSYDASKAAVHHMTTKFAQEFASRNITANAIAPGLVPSAMSAQLTAYASGDDIKRIVPLGRAGAPADMAGVCLWLSSCAGSWTSGAIIPVDGAFNATKAAGIPLKAML
eukprot:CAMPEP_0177668694 /NCGR_PEP_ID=MMETSP0447-20121125/22942_1 /TAXON_ID=0 /ORGANISM="Stygamoeba regulata, Strain BSH-02190019" /LENGTH=275 /DNA_ID=CAMNT_0019175307 /DNA_START=113 /DNA_END=940 /DNA_ORIENTATION=+